jgi:hypothetical protein
MARLFTMSRFLLICLVGSIFVFSDSYATEYNFKEVFKKSENALSSYLKNNKKLEYSKNDYEVSVKNSDNEVTVSVTQTLTTKVDSNHKIEDSLTLYFIVDDKLVNKGWLKAKKADRAKLYDLLLSCYKQNENSEQVDETICSPRNGLKGHIEMNDEVSDSIGSGVWLSESKLNQFKLKHAHLSMQHTTITSLK